MSMVINHQPDFLRVGPLRTHAFDYGTQRVPADQSRDRRQPDERRGRTGDTDQSLIR